MVLAAGLGTRLWPLTAWTPKPLMPVGGVPIIDRHLLALAAAGVEEVVISVHHQARVIEDHVGDGRRFGLRVVCSRQPELLGTGGGLARVRRRFEDQASFVVVNADLYHEFDITALVERTATSKAPATLVVAPHPGGGLGWIGADETGLVRRVPDMEPVAGLRRWAFTGLAVLTPAILDELPEIGCVMRSGYRRLVESGRHPQIDCPDGGVWCDIGTPDGLVRANLHAERAGSRA
jgi:N-acetyl-alpha-D-muramate 1-phosphate uridylyltransferase